MEEVFIYNPDSEDFSIQCALHEGKPTLYTIKALQMQKFPAIVAERMKEALADKLFEKRGKSNYHVDIKEIHKEIHVELKPRKGKKNG